MPSYRSVHRLAKAEDHFKEGWGGTKIDMHQKKYTALCGYVGFTRSGFVGGFTGITCKRCLKKMQANKAPSGRGKQRGMTLSQVKDKYFPNIPLDELEGRKQEVAQLNATVRIDIELFRPKQYKDGWYYAVVQGQDKFIGLAKKEPFTSEKPDPVKEPGELWFEFGDTPSEAFHAIVSAQQGMQRIGLLACISKWFGAIAHR